MAGAVSGHGLASSPAALAAPSLAGGPSITRGGHSDARSLSQASPGIMGASQFEPDRRCWWQLMRVCAVPRGRHRVVFNSQEDVSASPVMSQAESPILVRVSV
jgi:hypothetical protein